MPNPGPGLRERKKAQTRAAISDVATRLFIARGFDAVTVADIAEAAGVSAKTVFNYFGSKEELFLDRDAAMRELIAATVAERPPGTTPTAALGALLEANCIIDREGWAAVEDPAWREPFAAFLATWEATPALRARLLMGNELLAAALAAGLAAECAAPAGDPAVRAFAAMLVSAVHLRHRAICDGVLAGLPGAEIRRGALAVAGEVLARAAAAFPDLDRARPAG
ncbi:TetR/AcrR family transcriptional regulator [Miltoncostaea marina]|uniref:TetR/AcrR family transcriptional regulator n=1 Tax=Miltoncostaea marina TaxID=2843215 RepID=UPI001C3E5425|nr:TetR/AcrR family transcriptional regulator [Miltoncostaea marina]